MYSTDAPLVTGKHRCSTGDRQTELFYPTLAEKSVFLLELLSGALVSQRKLHPFLSQVGRNLVSLSGDS